jgi:hypothetical protein
VTNQKQKGDFVFQRGKPNTKPNREIYSRIMERWDEPEMMNERIPIKARTLDPVLAAQKGYVESNVEFSWSNVINWFGDEGKRIKKVLWEMEIE